LKNQQLFIVPSIAARTAKMSGKDSDASKKKRVSFQDPISISCFYDSPSKSSSSYSSSDVNRYSNNNRDSSSTVSPNQETSSSGSYSTTGASSNRSSNEAGNKTSPADCSNYKGKTNYFQLHKSSANMPRGTGRGQQS
jgi:hypothetical protein